LRPLFPVTRYRSPVTGVIVGVAFAAALTPAFAEKKYDPGASDTEIKIGQTKPYSGPASAYSSAGKVQFGYFEMLNSEGGVNGRKIKLISLDDAFTPPKTVEQTRKLVEQEEVLLVFNSNGTAANGPWRGTAEPRPRGDGHQENRGSGCAHRLARVRSL
jgi:hypothetical protein